MKYISLEERSFGTDPEFGVYDAYNDYAIMDGNRIPKLIPPAAFVTDYGLKFTVNKNGKREFFKNDCGSIIEDGAAFEFNVTPSLGGINLTSSVTNLKNQLISVLGKVYNKYLQISSLPYAYFDPKLYWEGRDESFTDCVRFGCDPDYFPKYYLDIGLEKEKPHEINVSKHTGRYFGGHIHVQNMTDDVDCYVNQQAFLPIVFDFIVGTMNCLITRDRSSLFAERKRLEYYGHPGRGRLQKYSEKVNGYEYRPPSNFWLSRPDCVLPLLSSANIACRIAENNLARDFFFTFKEQIPEMWDTCIYLDKNKAQAMFDKCIEWAVNNNIVFLDETTDIYSRMEYL